MLSLGLGTNIGGAGVSTPVVAPRTDWRLQVTDTYDSAGADSTFRTAMLAQHTAKTFPDPSSLTVSAGVTRDVSVKVAAIAAPGGMLGFWTNTWSGATFYASFSGTAMTVSFTSFGTIATGQTIMAPGLPTGVTIVSGSGSSWTLSAPVSVSGTVMISSSLRVIEVWESEDSTDGSAGDGTWTRNPFHPGGSMEGGQRAITDRAQIVHLADGPARWVRIRMINGDASTGSFPSDFIAGQLYADGSHDIWSTVGMSITRANFTRSRARGLIRTLVSGSDPYIIDLPRGGANASAMSIEMIRALATDQYQGVARCFFDFGPNDVAYASVRPWSGSADDILRGTRFNDNLTALQAIYGAANVYASNISYMNFHTGDGDAGASPYVDNVVDSANGSLPYNNEYINPLIESLSPISWSGRWAMPLVDDYWGQLIPLIGTVYPADPLHGGEPFWSDRRAAFIRRAYDLADGDTTVEMVMAKVGAANISDRKAVLVSLAEDCFTDTANATALANRAALVAQANGIVTTFADPAVTGSAILPADVTTGTLAAYWDAEDFEAITSNFSTGKVSAFADRSGNGYTVSQGTDSLRPIWAPKQFDGEPAKMDFAAQFGNTLASTNATLKALLDGASPAYTIFCVVTVPNAGTSGYTSGLFALGGSSASLPRVAIRLNAGHYRPSFSVSAAAKTDWTPADTSLVAGDRYAFAFRVNGAALDYFRGAGSSAFASATTTNTGAITTSVSSTKLAVRESGDANSRFNNDFHELSLFTGAVSDAEIGNVLDGLRQKYSSGIKTCI